MHQYFGTGSQALQVAQYCMPDYKAYKAHPEDVNLSVSAGVEEHHDELIVRAANRQVLRQTTSNSGLRWHPALGTGGNEGRPQYFAGHAILQPAAPATVP